MAQSVSSGGKSGVHGEHRHLALAPQHEVHHPRWDRGRIFVVLFAVASVLAFAVSFTKPWWTFRLYAPQYPKGLNLVISLTGMGGDVHEIDLLNHYIGMSHLADAAPLERQLAGWGVAAICLVTLAALVVLGKRFNKFIAVPAILFPLMFLADSFVWLYTFGHNLDPKAPIKLGAFTPEMFGNGKIGQFATFATPAIGFWFALVGVAFAITATVIRMRVCSGCERAGSCGATCPRFMILPDKKEGGAS